MWTTWTITGENSGSWPCMPRRVGWHRRAAVPRTPGAVGDARRRGVGVMRQALLDVLNGRTAVSVEMAIRLSKAHFSTREQSDSVGTTPENRLGIRSLLDLSS